MSIILCYTIHKQNFNNMNTPSRISDNISLIAEPSFSEYASYLIGSYTDNEPLMIVVAEHSIGGCALSEFKGIADALEAAEADLTQKVLLISTLQLSTLLLQNTDLALFLRLPNAFFARLPFAKITFEKAEYTDVMKAQAVKSLTNLVRTLNHATEKHLHDNGEVIDQMLMQRNAQVKRIQSHFPELHNLTGKDFITELKRISTELPIKKAMPGKEISGVYCDIEGTLLIDGAVQRAVLQQLHDYEAQGLPVTIWTLGDIGELEPIIRNAGIAYPIRNKMDYSGAIAEIVIDNDSEETFRAKTQITPKQFIQV